METIIVKEGGSIKGLTFIEDFMALVIFIDWYFRSLVVIFTNSVKVWC